MTAKAEQRLISENIRKLRMTFSRILPDLKINRGVVAFFSKVMNTLVVFSLKDGKLVYEKTGADMIIPAVINLKCRNIPLNELDRKTMEKVLKAFKHIEEISSDTRYYAPARLNEKDASLIMLKKELARKIGAMRHRR